MQFNLVISTNLPAVNLWKKFYFEIIGTIPEAFKNLKLKKYVDAYIFIQVALFSYHISQYLRMY